MNTIVLAAQSGQTQGGGFSMIIMMVILFVIMWLFMIRPQQKKQKEIRKFQNALEAGTKVVTAGGIHGTVKRVDLAANAVDVEIAHGVTVTIDKNFIYADASSQIQKG